MNFGRMSATTGLQSMTLGLWATAALAFVCLPFVFMAGLGHSASQIDARILQAAKTQLATKIEQRNIPTPVVEGIANLLGQNALGLNYLTLRNADRVIMVSQGDLENSLTWLPAGQARKWRGAMYRSSSFDRSAPLRADGEIVGYIDYGIAFGRLLGELALGAWLALIGFLVAGIFLVLGYGRVSTVVHAWLRASSKSESTVKPAPKLVRTNLQAVGGAALVQQLCDPLGMGYVTVDGQGAVVDINVNAARLLGYELRRLPGQPIGRLLVLEDADFQKIQDPLMACLQGAHKSLTSSAWLRRRDGKLVGLEMQATRIASSARVAAGMFFWEVSDSLNSQQEAEEAAGLAGQLMQHMSQAVVITNSAGKILDANEFATTLLGMQRQPIKAKSIFELLPDIEQNVDIQTTQQSVSRVAVEHGRALQAQVTLRPIRWQSKSAVLFFIQEDIVTSQDSEAVSVSNTEASWSRRSSAPSYHDPVTGLANRRHLTEQIMRCIGADEDPQNCLLLFIDIVNFKLINHTYGREVGDKALARLAGRLDSLLTDENTRVVRLGGDEFAALRTGSDIDEKVAIDVANALRVGFDKPLKLDDKTWQFNLDIGMSIAPLDADTPEKLIEHAEIAMYAAKSASRHEPMLYAPGMRHSVQGSTAGQELAQALATNAIDFLLQPILSLQANQHMVVARVGLRWCTVQGETHEHETIQSLAGEAGLSMDLAAWLLNTAAKEYAEWRNLGIKLVPICIEVPFAVLDAGEFIRQITRTVTRYHLPDGALILCLTGDQPLQTHAIPHSVRTAFASKIDITQSVSADFIMLPSAWVNALPEDAQAVAEIKKAAAYARQQAKPLIAGPVTNAAQRSALAALNVSFVYGAHVGELTKPRPFARQLAKHKIQPV